MLFNVSYNDFYSLIVIPVLVYGYEKRQGEWLTLAYKVQAKLSVAL